MDRLNIRLSVNASCELIAEDLTNYDSSAFNDVDYDSHISIEGLISIHDNLADINTINCREFCKTTNHPEARTSRFVFPKDGTFTYYKILIPKASHFSIIPKGGKLYYDDLEESNTFGKIVYIIGTEVQVIAPEDLRKMSEYSNFPNVICVKKIVFTACKLQKCLVNLQRKVMEMTLSGTCTKSTVDIENRDFLLSAMYVLDYLKDRAEYDKAQEIIDNLPTCQICDSNSLDIVDCGCNK